MTGFFRRALDPQVATLLEQIRAQAAAQPAPQTPLSQQEEMAGTRQFMATLAQLAIASESVARVEDREIPGSGGKLRIRSYAPETGTPLPVLVYYHGGGFVAGDRDGCDTTARALANPSRCMVVSAEYRLAPEHPYPAANEVAGPRWSGCLKTRRSLGRCAASGRRRRERGRPAGSLGRAALREARTRLAAAVAAVPQPRRDGIDAFLDRAGRRRVPPCLDERTFPGISAERCRPAFGRGFAFVCHRAAGSRTSHDRDGGSRSLAR